jgi:hypothetical protein
VVVGQDFQHIFSVFFPENMVIRWYKTWIKEIKHFKLNNISHVLNNQYSITIHHSALSVHNSHSVSYPTCFKLLTNHHQSNPSLKYGTTAPISLPHRIQSTGWQYSCISFTMQHNMGFAEYRVWLFTCGIINLCLVLSPRERKSGWKPKGCTLP